MDVRSRPFAVPALAVLLILGGLLALRAHHGSVAQALGGGRQVGRISAAERAGTFVFDPSIAPADRAAIVRAVADANPQAQALIGAVDGLVNIRLAGLGSKVVGLTESDGDRYDVTLDLGTVSREYGQRGIDRLVQHELGHVVDFALVPEDMNKQLDAQIPQGYGCEDGNSGGCANRDERFAESFAKWASGDIGVDLYLGYKVPPPDDLSSWGAPLATLIG
ncbi:hypothetical protein [Conexibacter woesei]|uniref:hypothetical protein n=1 Tax=Conexibacter woesei TaxID=191495 RepID=UPI0003FBD610|nr:hypothetical protein [Conexibacter woesei]